MSPTTKTAAALARATPRARWRSLRNFAISLLRLMRVPNIKAALRDLAANARKIFTMLRL
jgi:hypothetical protein